MALRPRGVQLHKPSKGGGGREAQEKAGARWGRRLQEGLGGPWRGQKAQPQLTADLDCALHPSNAVTPSLLSGDTGLQALEVPGVSQRPPACSHGQQLNSNPAGSGGPPSHTPLPSASPGAPVCEGAGQSGGQRPVSQQRERERRTRLPTSPTEPLHRPRPGGLGQMSPSPSRALRDAPGVTERGSAGDAGFPVATGWGALSWASEHSMRLSRTATCSSWGPLALSDPWRATLHPRGGGRLRSADSASGLRGSVGWSVNPQGQGTVQPLPVTPGPHQNFRQPWHTLPRPATPSSPALTDRCH